MTLQKVPEDESAPHHDRMRRMVDHFLATSPDNRRKPLGVFGAVDIGQGAYWWDYGQLRLYFENSIRVTEVRFVERDMQVQANECWVS